MFSIPKWQHKAIALHLRISACQQTAKGTGRRWPEYQPLLYYVTYSALSLGRPDTQARQTAAENFPFRDHQALWQIADPRILEILPRSKNIIYLYYNTYT